MTFSSQGIDQLKLLLNRAKSIPEQADQELGRIAMDLRDMARNMAPEDYGDLKNSIKHQRVGGGRNALGRFESGLHNWIVYVKNDYHVQDPEKAKIGIETAGQYAWFIHEYMGWGSTPGAPNGKGKPFMPSVYSQMIGLSHGVESGGKFLERAGIEIQRTMSSKIGTIVLKHIAALDK